MHERKGKGKGEENINLSQVSKAWTWESEILCTAWWSYATSNLITCTSSIKQKWSQTTPLDTFKGFSRYFYSAYLQDTHTNKHVQVIYKLLPAEIFLENIF